MKNRLTHSILLAAGVLAYHGSAAALSLSDLAVHSALDQPLRADLVLPQTDPVNAQRVRVTIRPAATVDPRSDAARFVERFRPSVLINVKKNMPGFHRGRFFEFRQVFFIVALLPFV